MSPFLFWDLCTDFRLDILMKVQDKFSFSNATEDFVSQQQDAVLSFLGPG